MEKKNNNPFTMRKEIMLIEYEDVIKCRYIKSDQKRLYG